MHRRTETAGGDAPHLAAQRADEARRRAVPLRRPAWRASNDGRRPLRQSARSVNCDTARTAPAELDDAPTARARRRRRRCEVRRSCAPSTRPAAGTVADGEPDQERETAADATDRRRRPPSTSASRTRCTRPSSPPSPRDACRYGAAARRRVAMTSSMDLLDRIAGHVRPPAVRLRVLRSVSLRGRHPHGMAPHGACSRSMAYLVAFAAEFSSTRIGVPFGLYHYIDVTRDRELWISNVPFWDSLSFTFLCYLGWRLGVLLYAPLVGPRRATSRSSTRAPSRPRGASASAAPS